MLTNCRRGLFTTLFMVGALSISLISEVALAHPKKAKKGEIHTQNVKEAGPDFEFQGEYVGTLDLGDETQKTGLQVQALGNGKFDGKGYKHGLPGAGWDKSKIRTLAGERKEDKVILQVKKLSDDEPDAVVVIKKGEAVVALTDSGEILGKLKKVIRKSPTLGKKPPKGAVIIFNGKPGPGVPKERITKEGELKVGGPGGKAFTSAQKFQSAKIHIEFRTPFRPNARGQNRGNSGLYVQERYEVQVLDSFSLKGTMGEAGGIYSVAPPTINMCFPPLSWQTYDIDYTAAKFDENGKMTVRPRMTVRHNGVLIHDDVEIKGRNPRSKPAINGTTAAPKKGGPEPRGIYLQQHGSSLLYRNIWFVPVK